MLCTCLSHVVFRSTIHHHSIDRQPKCICLIHVSCLLNINLHSVFRQPMCRLHHLPCYCPSMILRKLFRLSKNKFRILQFCFIPIDLYNLTHLSKCSFPVHAYYLCSMFHHIRSYRSNIRDLCRVINHFSRLHRMLIHSHG